MSGPISFETLNTALALVTDPNDPQLSCVMKLFAKLRDLQSKENILERNIVAGVFQYTLTDVNNLVGFIATCDQFLNESINYIELGGWSPYEDKVRDIFIIQRSRFEFDVKWLRTQPDRIRELIGKYISRDPVVVELLHFGVPSEYTGVVYSFDQSMRVFSEDGPIMRRVKQNGLPCEVGAGVKLDKTQPVLIKTEAGDEESIPTRVNYERLFELKLDNICAKITDLWFDVETRDNTPRLVLKGSVIPFGPMSNLFNLLVEDRAYLGARSMISQAPLPDQNEYKIEQIVTWDLYPK